MPKRTVFVIGAGASAPYAVPLGKSLIRQVADALPFVIDGPQGYRPPEAEPNTQYPFGCTSPTAKRLQRRIAQSTPFQTIDQFIARQPEPDRTFLLQAMIWALWQAEEVAVNSTTDEQEDWIGWLLANRMHSSIDSRKLPHTCFVTFNYERTVLLRMALQIASFTSSFLKDCVKELQKPDEHHPCPKARFSHVYGQIGVDPIPINEECQFDFQRDHTLLTEATKNTGVMFESEDTALSARQQRATATHFYEQLWEWAEQIIFLGFGFHSDNLDRICLTPTALGVVGKRGFIGGTGYRMSPVDQGRIRDWAGSAFILAPPEIKIIPFLDQHLIL
ncbi:MAG: hypothetical protein DHS20C14_16340 [Phycisphaeraceae bacterium]|nr:MAG: hypothetical protein DHS20C14_16340 [Phycisphaeraceae bacterium]